MIVPHISKLTTFALLILVCSLFETNFIAALKYRKFAQRDKGKVVENPIQNNYRRSFASIKTSTYEYYEGCLITNLRVLLCSPTPENKPANATELRGLNIHVFKKYTLFNDEDFIVSAKVFKHEKVVPNDLLGPAQKRLNLEKVILDREIDLEFRQVRPVEFYNGKWDRKTVTLSGVNYRCGYHTFDSCPVIADSSDSTTLLAEFDPDNICPPAHAGIFMFVPVSSDHAPVLIGSLIATIPEEPPWEIKFTSFSANSWLTE